tara:strand:- start:64082 stop:64783 length:702 start_codon:yes stop_codon:yes gene_type:complete
MKDLIRESGLPRKTIHYYFNEGLLPPPRKSGRNTATYGPEHLERLQQICILREQQFVPVKIIKAFYDDSASVELTAEQQQYVREMRLGLPDSIRPGAEKYVKLKEVFGKNVSAQELKAFKKQGLIKVIGSGAASVISTEDAVVVDSWIRFRDLGFTPDKGYGPEMLKLWDHAIEQLVVQEITHLADGLCRVSETESQQVTQEAMLIVSKLIEALHHKKTRIQFSKLDADNRSE